MSVSYQDLRAIHDCLDAIEDEANTGLTDPLLDTADTDSRYALDSIKRIGVTAKRRLRALMIKAASVHSEPCPCEG